jgi:hypothetical protein
MTDDRMALRGFLEKSADAELLGEMIGFAAERLMELEVRGVTGAGRGERSPDRLVQRNGCRDRDWETRAGTVELRIPKLRPWRPAGRPASGDRMIRLLNGSWARASRVSWSRGGRPGRR